MMRVGLGTILDDFAGVGLKDLDCVRLMNRIDTKYLLPVGRINDLIEKMKGHYRILEIDGNRVFDYNTIYFDTSDYLFFNQHVTGRAERSKVRLRYYISTGTSFLEVKRKTRKNRTIKWRMAMPYSESDLDDRSLAFLGNHLPDVSDTIRPILQNGFTRITFAGIGIPERVTIDTSLSFVSTEGKSSDHPYLAIAELKSEGIAARSLFAGIIRQLSFHPSGFSKYCLGNAILIDLPRKNILKPKLLLLNKLENDFKSSVNA
jgi:hypothetical protein